MFASPVGGEEAKLRNGQLCIFHCSGSLGRTGIRRREVGRWGDSEDGAGRKKNARSRIERGRRGGEYFQKSIKRQEKGVVSCFHLHWRACGFGIFESMKSLPSRGGRTLMSDLMMFFFILLLSLLCLPGQRKEARMNAPLQTHANKRGRQRQLAPLPHPTPPSLSPRLPSCP